jgi:DNA-binding transcriptional regulator GbsR (MarR family)
MQFNKGFTKEDLECLKVLDISELTKTCERINDDSMNSMSEAVRQYVEETGVLLEDAGLPRMAGQILGWLQVCEPETQSHRDIIDALGISRASVSTVTRFLENVGVVERTMVPGDRRDFYRISRDAWHRFMQSRVETMRKLRRNADQGLRALANETPERRERLERMRRLYAFLEREMPKLLARFETEEGDSASSYSDQLEVSDPA